tara:strand:+ start:3276 stop:3857 length:582 start_codon:yes stop_codon:yes gene_type:complete
MKLKKAAMFGLDARIALAIFGALSVISGAALYSAIQQAKVVAIVTELNEISKAAESLMLDTGVELAVHAGDQLKLKYLLEDIDSVPGWNGPYISGYTAFADNGLNHPQYTGVHILKFQKHLATGARTGCSSGLSCDIWVHITGIPTELVKAVDEYVDGSYDLADGRVQGADYSGSVAGTHTISYKAFPALNQP